MRCRGPGDSARSETKHPHTPRTCVHSGYALSSSRYVLGAAKLGEAGGTAHDHMASGGASWRACHPALGVLVRLASTLPQACPEAVFNGSIIAASILPQRRRVLVGGAEGRDRAAREPGWHARETRRQSRAEQDEGWAVRHGRHAAGMQGDEHNTSERFFSGHNLFVLLLQRSAVPSRAPARAPSHAGLQP